MRICENQAQKTRVFCEEKTWDIVKGREVKYNNGNLI